MQQCAQFPGLLMLWSWIWGCGTQCSSCYIYIYTVPAPRLTQLGLLSRTNRSCFCVFFSYPVQLHQPHQVRHLLSIYLPVSCFVSSQGLVASCRLTMMGFPPRWPDLVHAGGEIVTLFVVVLLLLFSLLELSSIRLWVSFVLCECLKLAASVCD